MAVNSGVRVLNDTRNLVNRPIRSVYYYTIDISIWITPVDDKHKFSNTNNTDLTFNTLNIFSTLLSDFIRLINYVLLLPLAYFGNYLPSIIHGFIELQKITNNHFFSVIIFNIFILSTAVNSITQVKFN